MIRFSILISFLLIAAPALALPQRIVSLNLCADLMLLSLVDEGRIAGLTPLVRDPSLSPRPDISAPILPASIEAVLTVRPDLVVTTPWSGRLIAEALAGAGIAVVYLSGEDGLASGIEQLRTLGRAVGAEQAAERLIEEIDAAKAPAPHGGRAVAWQPRGLSAGPGTLAGDLLFAAGWQVVDPPGLRSLPLEALLVAAPDAILINRPAAGTSLGHRLFDHPALRALAVEELALPPGWTSCVGAWTPAAIARLRPAGPAG